MQALINEIELDFQRQLISGPPPLGPGAAPIDRLVAFGRERIRLITRQGDLIRAAEEPPETRYTSPPRAALHLHLRVLLKQSDFEGDTQVLAFTLLAALDAALVLHEHREANISLDRLANGWEELIRQVVAPVPSGHARPGGEALAEPV
ncbi:hypothetical protein [Lacisediminihabitans profunda]|nr:hypothetical protein [Lacisediminihabitans profunda]